MLLAILADELGDRYATQNLANLVSGGTVNICQARLDVRRGTTLLGVLSPVKGATDRLHHLKQTDILRVAGKLEAAARSAN